ncbi:carboxymuconolactone decarboxylase family protein [Paenibacillus chartarius]|uniref:Carboxymuconolactone decarboxylase family protein n=1 Tax=Paenibacillus chartarius TaxID=747481 RepID=A0ABV6DIC7_9BACL
MEQYYLRSNLNKIPELIKLAPGASKSFLAFERDVFHDQGAVPVKMKELIAIAVAHVTGCPYCIDVHVRKYKELGGTQEEILEAVLVAASTRAGAILSHATHALLSYEDNCEKHSEAEEKRPQPGPECFC